MPAAVNPVTGERFEGLSPDLVAYYSGQTVEGPDGRVPFEIEYDEVESARFPILNPGTDAAVVATPEGDEPVDEQSLPSDEPTEPGIVVAGAPDAQDVPVVAAVDPASDPDPDPGVSPRKR